MNSQSPDGSQRGDSSGLSGSSVRDFFLFAQSSKIFVESGVVLSNLLPHLGGQRRHGKSCFLFQSQVALACVVKAAAANVPRVFRRKLLSEEVIDHERFQAGLTNPFNVVGGGSNLGVRWFRRFVRRAAKTRLNLLTNRKM